MTGVGVAVMVVVTAVYGVLVVVGETAAGWGEGGGGGGEGCELEGRERWGAQTGALLRAAGPCACVTRGDSSHLSARAQNRGRERKRAVFVWRPRRRCGSEVRVTIVAVVVWAAGHTRGLCS